MGTSNLIQPTDININDVITFSSKSLNDDNVYYGKVISKCSFDLAKTYGDVVAMYNNVSLDANEPALGPIDTLNYILLRLMENGTNEEKFIIPFALEWMDTVSLVSERKRMTITVFDADVGDSAAILAALKSIGKIAKVENVY